MRNLNSPILLIIGLGAMLAACGSSGLLNRDRPDEFAVQRQAPLVVPPDFNLVPPQPGAPRPAEGTRQRRRSKLCSAVQQARSEIETSVLDRAGSRRAGIRSAVGDPAPPRSPRAA